ncbi:MAG: two-component regulator propeller domain-containing protein [Pyrinomonadaceae bacterium]
MSESSRSSGARRLHSFRRLRRPRTTHLALLAGLALLALLTASPLRAQYRFDARSTDNGLPQNSVRAILQTRDGYVWFTTYDGLVRYDGVRFTVFDKGSTRGIGGNRFDSLYEGKDGSLWAGTQDSGLTRYKDGSFRTYTTADGLPDNKITGVCDDGEGGLLVWTPAGVVVWHDGRLAPHPSLSALVRGVTVVMRDSAGAIWFNGQGGLCRFKDGSVSVFTSAEGLTDKSVSCIYEDHQGRLWVGTSHGGVYRLDGERFVAITAGQLPNSAIYALVEDARGDLWVVA